MDYFCTIKTHGHRQLELNLKYPLTRGAKACYHLDFYLFNPYQLAITRNLYGVASFFRDLRYYTRYTVPVIPLSKLIDLSCDVSPLTRINRILSKSSMASELNEKSVLYELRVLTNVYQRQLTDIRKHLKEHAGVAPNNESLTVYLKSSLEDIDRFLAAFRRLHQEFLDSRVSDMLRESLQWADESISLSTERFQYVAYNLLRENADMAPFIKSFEQRLDAEQQYRIQRGYATIINPDNEIGNELFVYREGILKKWSEGCLYLSRLPSCLATNIAQIMMGTAAGIAMLFAVLATIFASRWFVAESLPWVILIVGSYIAKDRIKEVLRSILITLIPSLMADQIENLIDPALGDKVGASRSRVRFCKPGQIPELAVRLRNIKADMFRNIIPPEDILHYHKSIWFNSDKIRTVHKRLESLTEIIRLKLDYWFANMDDPANELSCMRNGTVISVAANRVYHVNLVVCLSDCAKPGKSQSLFRYRMILTRDGILRIEPLESFRT